MLLTPLIYGLLMRLEDWPVNTAETMRHLTQYVTVAGFRGVLAHGLEVAPTRRALQIPRGQNKRIIFFTKRFIF